MRRFRGFDRQSRSAIMRKLLDRDGRLCGLCETGLDFTLPTDHPAAVTIDHIVPVAAGGEIGGADRVDNLRLTHSRCNGLRVRTPTLRPSWFARELRISVEAQRTRESSA